MKRLSVVGIILANLAFAALAQGGPLADSRWDKSHLEALRALDKPAVTKLLNDLWSHQAPFSVPNAKEIGAFSWADLDGDGQYELVATQDVNGRGFFNALVIYRQDPSRNVTTQELRGWMIGGLASVIRDLRGDGREELVIPTELISYSTAEIYTWPVVYCRKGERYVEASRDFPEFYAKEVLPELDKQISDPHTSAGLVPILIFERDKIQRMLGRDPVAGLQQAYQWMNSDDPRLLQLAAATFQDIGGHQAEMRAAVQARDRALCKSYPAMAMCAKIATDAN